jgi:branched-chain amino acid transport system substrate-binding protein
VEVETLAAGDEGVWLLIDDTVVQIDPRTNRLGQRIRIGSPAATAIAVGAGSVWATAEQEGVVWRIDPGPNPVTRTIDVGVGVTYIAFGAGAVWTANYVDGVVTRIDPSTNTVTDRVPVGAAQALAAGPGSAWVSTAGRPSAGGLPEFVCGELASGGREPDVLIASDFPLQGPTAAGPRAMVDAIRHVLEQHGFRAGRYTVGYRSCDDSTAQTGDYEPRRCAANATAYAHAEQLVALIGPYNSHCTQIELPILNRAPGGPLATISPVNTYPGLTRPDGLAPPHSYRAEPEVYYPTGVRNYVRLKPGDDLQGAGHAALADQLGLDSAYLLHDGSEFWRALLIEPFRRAAGRLGIRMAGSESFDSSAPSYAEVADRVARSGAQGVVVGGDPYDGGDRLLKALRARLGKRVTIMGGLLFAFAPDVLEQAGRAARGVYATTLDLPTTALPLTEAGRRFAREVGAFEAPLQGVLEAGQATELVLRAIARSDGTRASVLEELRASRVRDGILGSFRFDRNGDITAAQIPIVRITGATPPGAGIPQEFQGAVVDRVVEVPASLAGR